MLRAFSNRQRNRRTRKWAESEPGKFHLVYSKHREEHGVAESIRRSAEELKITLDRAYELWRGHH